jgi:hypothetical protein
MGAMLPTSFQGLKVKYQETDTPSTDEGRSSWFSAGLTTAA